MNLIVKILFYFTSKLAHWQVVCAHWFWVKHYKGQLSLSAYKLSDKPLVFKLDFKSQIQIAKDVVFAGTSKLLAEQGGQLRIGQGTFFNTNCSINALEAVHIGDHCLFGESVKIYDHNHRFNLPEVALKDQGYTKSKVSIGNHCWVGSNVVILKGVTIGDHVVIGASCVVNQDIPSHTLVTLSQEHLTLSKIKLK